MNERRLPEPRMREEFRRELRARLMREAVVLAERRRDNAWTAWLRPGWLRPAFAVGLAAFLLVATAGAASAGSVPGDVGFGIKRVLEEARVALTFDEVARVQLLAELTDRRLAELQLVAGRSDRAPTASREYADAVTRFQTAVQALREAAPEEKREKAGEVADAAQEKHEALLEWLVDRLPEEAKPEVERAREEERRGREDRDRERGKDKKSDDEDDEDRSGGAPSTRTGAPTATPRATRTAAPRSTERVPTARPTPTRELESDRD